MRRGWQRCATGGLVAITALAGTIGLAASPAAAAGPVDQQQQQASYCAGNDGVGQTFTAGRTGNLDQIDVLIAKPPGTTNPFTVQIRTGDEFQPFVGDTVLATTQVPAALVPDVGVPGTEVNTFVPPTQYVSIPIGPVPVTAGTLYSWTVVQVQDGLYGCYGDDPPNPYEGGHSAFFDRLTGHWIGSGGLDTTFRTYVSRFPTTLVANPSVVKLSGLKLYLTLSARLTSNGSGVAGQTVNFSAGNKAVCSAVTNANGDAACGGLIPGTLASVLALGYTASFGGDAVYAPSSDHGPLIR
jgi:hypothetical protein